MRKKMGNGEDFCRLMRQKALDSARIFRFEGERKSARELLSLAAASLAVSMLPLAREIVRHPAEWRCSGLHELTGMKDRYRIIDREKACVLSGFADMQEFSRWYLSQIESLVENRTANFFPFDAMAVGDNQRIGEIAVRLPGKFREIRRCRIPEMPEAKAIFVSKKWGRSITRTI